MTTARVSRNDPCPCGSGKKFKKCCLSSSESTPRFSQSLTSAPAAMRAPSEILPHTAIHSSIAAKKWNEVVFDAPLKNGGRLHAVLLYSDDGLSAGMIRRGEILILDLSEFNFRGPSTVVAIHRTSISDAVEAQAIRIVQFRDDDDLGKALFGQWKPPQGFVERWASCRRTIIMRMDFPDGQWCDIQLVRTVKWTEQNGVRVGGTVFLDLTDVGVRGWANVLEILCCPVPEEFGAGEIVTGTFKHSHGRIGELVLESEPKPISVTPSHLFWSEDRQNWVQVSQLHPGETVMTMEGFTRVVSFTMTDRVEQVYNLEVGYDHCYRVGEVGVLVHNTSAPDCCEIEFSLTGTNPNTLVSSKVSGEPSTGNGVYVKKHEDKVKVGSADNFRTRYILSKPEGGCNIWYELPRTKSGPPAGLSLTTQELQYWTAHHQNEFDEAYVWKTIPSTRIWGIRPVSPMRWRSRRHIFGYASLPDTYMD